MFKIFDNLADAKKLCEDINKFMSENCKNYSASLWQIPVKAEKVEQYYVQLPVEFDAEIDEKPLYQTNEKISLSLKSDTDKCILSVSKLPDDFIKVSAVEAEQVKG